MPELVKNKLCNGNISSEFIYLIAVGGDGTLKEVCQGIILSEKKNVMLGYIPSGTANIMAKELSVDNSVIAACKTVLRAENFINLKLAIADDEYFLFTCGIGFDGKIVKNVNLNLKKRIGGIAYLLSGVSALFSLKKFQTFNVSIDNKKFQIKSIIINRASRYAANIKIFKNVSIDKDFFEILIFKNINIKIVAQLLLDILLGRRQEKNMNYAFITGKNITVEKCSIPVQIDGDSVKNTPSEISVSNKSVNIIIP